jgi:hypothetical protein
MRALLSIKMAKDNLGNLLRNWNALPSGVKGALHSAAVISYARVFVHSATNVGKITYPSRQLTKAAGFDMELHNHILELRNQIIAHGDYGMFPSTMYVQTMGDERIPVVLGINVRGMFGIASRELALRYDKHLSFCDEKLEHLLGLECAELTAEAKLHPRAFSESHNIPEEHQAISLGADTKDFPGPIGPAATVENPAFPDGLSDYDYMTLTHQVALQESGEYTITNGGIEQKVTLFSR